jgi:predicted DNA-binding transcriptional regulator AlpA
MSNPAAQAAFTKKAAKVKAAKKAKQPAWLRQPMALPQSDTRPAPEQIRTGYRSQGPPRLLDKAEICAIANVTFPTVWAWMRAGTFPRGRIVGGKSMWLSSEVDAWVTTLPVRRLKGDPS